MSVYRSFTQEVSRGLCLKKVSRGIGLQEMSLGGIQGCLFLGDVLRRTGECLFLGHVLRRYPGGSV